MATAEDVQRIALSLPETQPGEDRLGFAVRGKSFTWTCMERVGDRRGRVARPDVMAVRVDGAGTKQELLAADPEKFFTTDHYTGYPAVLVRLDAVDVDELSELLTDGWRCQAPKRLVKEFDSLV
jgi:hypothetical protein